MVSLNTHWRVEGDLLIGTTKYFEAEIRTIDDTVNCIITSGASRELLLFKSLEDACRFCSILTIQADDTVWNQIKKAYKEFM